MKVTLSIKVHWTHPAMSVIVCHTFDLDIWTCRRATASPKGADSKKCCCQHYKWQKSGNGDPFFALNTMYLRINVAAKELQVVFLDLCPTHSLLFVTSTPCARSKKVCGPSIWTGTPTDYHDLSLIAARPFPHSHTGCFIILLTGVDRR